MKGRVLAIRCHDREPGKVKAGMGGAGKMALKPRD